ncbi:hypothetical protein FRC15_001302 [Serendipita sp. 397]|nr:hypothetical protein FRC15_001302 [Serendipita sp. 397]
MFGFDLPSHQRSEQWYRPIVILHTISRLLYNGLNLLTVHVIPAGNSLHLPLQPTMSQLCHHEPCSYGSCRHEPCHHAELCRYASEKVDYINLDHSSFPKLAEKWVTGWKDTCNSGTVASAILASVAGAIFIHVEEKLGGSSPDADPNSTKAITLIVFTYLAVLSNCTAAVLSFFISDKLIASPLLAELKPPATHVHQDELFNALKKYFMWNRWTPTKYYWLANLSAGFLFLFGEFALYAWIFEKRLAVKLVVLVFSFLGVIPLIMFWLEIFTVIARR